MRSNYGQHGNFSTIPIKNSLIDAPWYVTDETIHNLKIPTVKEEISKFSNTYVEIRVILCMW